MCLFVFWTDGIKPTAMKQGRNSVWAGLLTFVPAKKKTGMTAATPTPLQLEGTRCRLEMGLNTGWWCARSMRTYGSSGEGHCSSTSTNTVWEASLCSQCPVCLFCRPAREKEGNGDSPWNPKVRRLVPLQSHAEEAFEIPNSTMP